MIYWGLALAAGPNPNSRSGGMPDDPPLGVTADPMSREMNSLEFKLK